MKRSAIVGNKHGIYELPHELPNDLRTIVQKVLGDGQIAREIFIGLKEAFDTVSYDTPLKKKTNHFGVKGIPND